MEKMFLIYLFIYGDSVPLDFSGRKYSHCGFYGYSSLLNCNLDHAFFSYTTVDIETQELSGYHITRDTFDSTCSIGRLSRFLGEGLNSEVDEIASNEEMLRRFFLNFIESNSFVDKHIRELVFPLESMNIKSRFFREAINQHIIYLSKDSDRCGITRVGEKVVHNYLTNNVMETRIFKVLKKL